MSKESTDNYLSLWKQWERYLKARYPGMDMRKTSKTFAADESRFCQKEGIAEYQLLDLVQIRNLQVHSESFFEIKEEAVSFLLKLVNSFCKKALDIATYPVHTTTPEMKVIELITDMDRNLYTHVPVIQGDNFYGIFSENTLLSIVSSRIWSEGLQVKDILPLVKANKSDLYEFMSETAEFYEVYGLFQNYIVQGKRLGAVLLTETGEESGDIKGIITAWDLHKGLN